MSYFLPFPVRALSRHFRGRMVSALRNAAKAGDLAGIGPVEVSALLDDLMAEDWVVYAKPCLEHTESVITYLARSIALTTPGPAPCTAVSASMPTSCARPDTSIAASKTRPSIVSSTAETSTKASPGSTATSVVTSNLLPFSCKPRCFCPSCHQKRMLIYGE